MPILRRLWHATAGGFWLLPGVVAIAYLGLALALVRIDRAFPDATSSFAFDGDAGAARDLLSVVAGSLITVAGLAFSLTIVVLVLISSQFTPRALPGFLADRLNQAIAGSFVGIFAYCLVVLRTVRDAASARAEFVPGLSIGVGIVLALAALGLLLVFIHHMGRMIQASEIASRIGRETRAAVDRLHPDAYQASLREDVYDLAAARTQSDSPAVATAGRAGYVVDVPVAGLLGILDREDVRLHITVVPGDFVTASTQVCSVWAEASVERETLEALGAAISVAGERHLAHDAAYGARQLADIALKALSPGVNDPTTAESCIGYLRDILEQLATRSLPSAIERRLETGAVVVRRQNTFDDWLATAFDEIARFAAGNARVAGLLLEALAGIGAEALRVGAEERVRSVGRLANGVAAAALECSVTDRDREIVATRLQDVRGVVADRGAAR